MTLHDLIATRGGFQDPAFRKDTFLDTAHIFRKVAGTLGKQIIPFNLGALLDNAPNANLPLEEDDSVRIYSHAEMRMPQQVTIDGLIKQPGAFSMTVDMTLEDLIMMAGGLSPDAYKVEAAIARSEKDSTVSELTDLQLTTIKVPVSVKGYATLPQDQKTLLKAGDRVTIRSLPGWEKSPTVLIQGEVIEPGNYSLITEPETLSSLVKRAGGLKKEALPEGVTVKRRKSVIDMADAQSSEYYDITVYLPAALENPGGADDLVLKGDDQIFIPTNPGVVEVRGAVNRPLTLQHKPGRTLAEYIALCGGYLDKADPGKVKVFAANKVALNARVAEVAKGKNNKGNMGSPSLLNVPPGSVIEVPFLRETERLLTVEVKGAVAKPALVQHIEGAPLGYYLNLSGGFTPEADIDDISVLLPNGGLLVKTGNQPFNPVVPGGSLIMVSTKTIKEAK